MTRFAISCANLFLIFLLPSSASDDLPARIGKHSAAAELLALNPIRVRTGGQVNVPYAEAAQLLSSPTILADVQAEYARMLPRGERPEFVITQLGPSTYHYVNRAGQETRIEELFRAEFEGPRSQIAFYAAGRRFFGPFRALIVISAWPAAAGLAYEAEVYAYPEYAVSRFFARHLGLVERFFRYKTAEIEHRAVRIGTSLIERRGGLAHTAVP